MRLTIPFLTFLAAASSLLASSLVQASPCGIQHPTRWFIENQLDQDVHLECRVYAGGWSYQMARDVQFVLSPGQKITYTFGDHNDGVGMLERNWSCAFSPEKHPLSLAKSTGIKFDGCPNSTLILNKNLFDTHTLDANDLSASSLDSTSYCPETRTLKRLHDCTHPNCRWDSYGAGPWKGNGGIYTEAELQSFRFVGVDANEQASNALGCVYYSDRLDAQLILLSYLPAQSGSYPRFRFRPVDSRHFRKQAGYLKQCLSPDVKSCPLTNSST